MALNSAKITNKCHSFLSQFYKAAVLKQDSILFLVENTTGYNLIK